MASGVVEAGAAPGDTVTPAAKWSLTQSSMTPGVLCQVSMQDAQTSMQRAHNCLFPKKTYTYMSLSSNTQLIKALCMAACLYAAHGLCRVGRASKLSEHQRTLLANSGADGLLSSGLRCLDGPGRGLDVDVDVVLLDDLRVLDACIPSVKVSELDTALVVESAVVARCMATKSISGQLSVYSTFILHGSARTGGMKRVPVLHCKYTSYIHRSAH